MKKILIKTAVIAMSFFSIQSCSQQNQQQMNEKATELLGNLYKDVKYVGQGASYHAVVSSGGATVEVYINGYPVYREYVINDGSNSTSTPINKYILKKGEQNWEVRIYPAYNENGTKQKQISKGTRFLVRLEKLSFDKNGNVKTLTEPITLIETPMSSHYDEYNNEEKYYKEAGKPLMIYKGTFNAEIPYTLKGWSDSVDLTKENQDKLKDELVEKYQELWKILDRRETDKLAENILKRETEIAQALYYTKDLNDDYVHTFFDRFDKEGKKMLPLKNYKMVFYGNNIVTLESTDINYIYLPALQAEYNNGKKFLGYYLAFHRPKQGAPLEIIR